MKKKQKQKQNKTKQNKKTIDVVESSLLDKKFRDRFILYPA